jgi:hypothetical protein
MTDNAALEVRALWYGASVEYGDMWAYIEIKGLSEEDARRKLREMFRDGMVITYCELL